jgi:hypothetical protein
MDLIDVYRIFHPTSTQSTFFSGAHGMFSKIHSYTSDKGLITRIYRELIKLNSPRINEPIKKCATELNRTFSKEEIQMAKKHRKKCSPSLAIKEMQIKTTRRFYLTLVIIAIIKNTNNNNVGEDVGKK